MSSREEFEAWYRKNVCSWSNLSIDSDGEYFGQMARTAWKSWQASRQALVVDLDAANANHENAEAHMQSVCAERDRIKAENVQLLAVMMQIMNEIDGNMREIARGLINHGVSTYPDSPANPNDIYEYCDTIERLIAGVLSKEQP